MHERPLQAVNNVKYLHHVSGDSNSC